MKNVLLVYLTCGNLEQARKIAKHLMNKRLCACVNIFPDMHPMVFWPPKKNLIDESRKVVLIVKTIESKCDALEEEIY